MKAFISSIIKPKDASKDAKANTNQQQSAVDAIQSNQLQNLSSSSSSAASPVIPPTATVASSFTSASQSTSNPALPHLPPQPTQPQITKAAKKHAQQLLNEYLGVVACLFDHTQPVRKECDYFIEHMEESSLLASSFALSGPKDPVQEEAKANEAVKLLLTGLPIVKEQGMTPLQQMNEQIRASIQMSRDFLELAATKDELRRDHSIPSLGRLHVLQTSLDRELVEAKRVAHAGYVDEYARLHEKYGKVMENTRQNRVYDKNSLLATHASSSTSVSSSPSLTASADGTPTMTPQLPNELESSSSSDALSTVDGSPSQPPANVV